MYRVFIQSGNTIEVLEYEKPPCPPRVKRRSRVRYTKINRPKSARSVSRALVAFVRLVRSNLGGISPPALFTLTFEGIVPLKEGWRAYSLFAQRLRNKGFEGVLIAIPEFQERGSIHFHGLAFGELPLGIKPCLLSKEFYYDKKGKRHRKHLCPHGSGCERECRVVAKLWGHGYVDVVTTDGGERLSGYLGKYFTKAAFDERFFGAKLYSASRNALRPVRVVGGSADHAFEFIASSDNLNLQYKRQYETKWMGKCVYKSYSR